MTIHQKRIAIITGFCLVFVVIPLIIYGIYLANRSSTGITITTDPISGDQIMDAPTTPEIHTENEVPTEEALIYGIDNIAELYGDNYAFERVRANIFNQRFPNAKVIKIAQTDIVKQVYTESDTPDPYVAVDFSVYIDDNTTDKYRVKTKFMTKTGEITGTVTSPNGKVNSYPSN